MNDIRHPGLLVLLATVACITTHSSGKTGIRLAPDKQERLAAGARFDVAIADTCSNAATELEGKGQGKIPTGIVLDIGRQTCAFSSVTSIDKAESSNPDVLTVDKTAALGQYGVLTLLARDEGEVQISTTITTSTGVYQPTGTYSVLRANKASLQPDCGHNGGSRAGHIDALADRALDFTYKLMQDSQTLVGYGYYPFELGGFAISEGKKASEFSVAMPTTAQSITITSPIDPALSITLDVHTADSIDALNLALGPVVSCQAQLVVAPSAGEAKAFCNGPPEVDLFIETPEACSFSPSLDQATSMANANNEGKLTIHSRAKGTCRIRGQPVGGSYSESIDIPFAGCTSPPPTPGQAVEGWARVLENPVGEMADAGADGVLVFTDDKQGIFLHNGKMVALHAGAGKVDAAWAESASRYGYIAGDQIIVTVGGKRSSLSAGAAIFDAWLLGPGDVLLVGTAVGHFKDGAVQSMDINAFGTSYGVWAGSANLMYVVGYADQGDGHVAGYVQRFDGQLWKEAHPKMDKMFMDVWGCGQDDVFVVGMGIEDGTKVNGRTGGIAMRFDGTKWAETELPEGVGLNAVSGSGPFNVVAVGDGGVVMRWNGSAWSTRWLREAGDLRAVAVRRDGLVLLGGTKGLFELR